MSGLAGKRVLVTRPRAQAAALVEKLAALGAVPVIFPTIEIAPPEDPGPLNRAIAGLSSYAWVIFTSVNGVAAFWQSLEAAGKDSAAFTGVRVAAIGPATAQALRERGVAPAFVPEEYIAEAILPGLGEVSGRRILLPRADIARKALLDALQQQGALAEELAVYRTIPAQPDSQAFQALQQGVDIATFTSASTVRSFFSIVGERLGDEATNRLLKNALIACIGPITAEAARARGLAVGIIAEEYTVDGLVEALLKYEETHPVRNTP